MTDAEELARLRRFHALFGSEGKWHGTVGARLAAKDGYTNIWSVWRAAARRTESETKNAEDHARRSRRVDSLFGWDGG